MGSDWRAREGEYVSCKPFFGTWGRFFRVLLVGLCLKAGHGMIGRVRDGTMEKRKSGGQNREGEKDASPGVKMQ